ncbi:MAG: NAD(P)/FAD-dependent oxidoreductase [Pseudomonadota bacterium]
MQRTVIIIGAGPAGLTAAYLLAKQNFKVTVLEADPEYVGGIARTVTYKGYCFDIGGHRFFSKSQEVEDFWTEILPDDMLERPRSSRIFYQDKFFAYPLNAGEVLQKLGWFESAYCFFSYLKARLFPIKNARTFTQWVTNHFGARLFRIFFKTYTEKVWGMSCDKISADWAAQRIKGLSLWSAMINAFMPAKKSQKPADVIKTLVGTFRYPRKGPGMLWEHCTVKIRQLGGTVLLNSPVTKCDYVNGLWRVCCGVTEFTGDYVISSAPLRELVQNYLPAMPAEVAAAAAKLQYRDFIIVALILRDDEQFSDNWIYIHDPAVKVARIQNFKSWSPEMVPVPGTCCYGMEYFCFEGDGLWSTSDANLIALAKREIVQIGLAEGTAVLDGCVVRQQKAYPVYNDDYKNHVEIIRAALEEYYPTLLPVGRNGMHKYNNQDHAMMTAMLAVKNIIAGETRFDVWRVNEDAQYHEAGMRNVPERVE